MLPYQSKVYKLYRYSSHFHCFILQYRLVGCDKLVLLYCIYIWFGFTLVYSWNQLKTAKPSQLMQPQISLLNMQGRLVFFSQLPRSVTISLWLG